MEGLELKTAGGLKLLVVALWILRSISFAGDDIEASIRFILAPESAPTDIVSSVSRSLKCCKRKKTMQSTVSVPRTPQRSLRRPTKPLVSSCILHNQVIPSCKTYDSFWLPTRPRSSLEPPRASSLLPTSHWERRLSPYPLLCVPLTSLFVVVVLQTH